MSEEVIRALHSTAMAFVAHSDFDVVFVVENAADYAALQSIRKAASNEGRDEARRLAELVANGDVALFLGAGVNIPKSLPDRLPGVRLLNALGRRSPIADSYLNRRNQVNLHTLHSEAKGVIRNFTDQRTVLRTHTAYKHRLPRTPLRVT
ncbi:hypothetical protein [Rhodococcus sp. ARC_M5]|uniref:hypothetical protein n=1 Tax=Rhodococcus sp. ARC_M5 TaxID=2928851 RepID=UPI001FB3B01A|nr:hypothetical protein [Rhodococcus sp. ARC_M5]MCJ0893759.1 hypothetical protein [Rhodococcus sp. ARC_M5]